MNIFLIPYTWQRHLQMALWCAGAGLMAWWFALSWVMWIGPVWPPSMDGPMLLCTIAGAVSGASIMGEGNLRRRPLYTRLPLTLLATGLSVAFTFVWYGLWHSFGHAILFHGDLAEEAADSSLVSLRFRLGAFVMGGISTSLGPLLVRKGAGWATHLISGIGSGFAAAFAWHVMNSTVGSDLYGAGAAMGLVWGFSFGLLSWGIPDELYAGWLRVLSPNRFARRIPIDAMDRTAKERFIGHFPRGLDMFLPVEDGVLELHVSVAVDAKQRYFARGLTLAPTLVKRFLERIDLRYDPRRPAPLETRLKPGDRIQMGQGHQSSEVEFLMLPREER